VIFSELMDSNSLFLTANADTIYSVAILDLTKGPLVVEVPPRALGTLNCPGHSPGLTRLCARFWAQVIRYDDFAGRDMP
jgi:Protein of unknown function (DUF1254)